MILTNFTRKEMKNGHVRYTCLVDEKEMLHCETSMTHMSKKEFIDYAISKLKE